MMPIGTWPVYAPLTGFLTFDATLKPDDAPVQVYLDLTSAGTPKFAKDSAVLTLTVSADGKTVLATPLTFEDAVARDDTPQTPELIYRTRAGVIDPVDARRAGLPLHDRDAEMPKASTSPRSTWCSSMVRKRPIRAPSRSASR